MTIVKTINKGSPLILTSLRQRNSMILKVKSQSLQVNPQQKNKKKINDLV